MELRWVFLDEVVFGGSALKKENVVNEIKPGREGKEEPKEGEKVS